MTLHYPTLLTLLLGATLLRAQGPGSSATYYRPADGKTGAQLKTALAAIIYPRTERSYAQLWTDFQQTDARADGSVWDMYSAISHFQFGTDQDKGSGNQEGQFYNREHSWPNSWFGGQVQPMYTDLHHLYPTDKVVNNRRGNLPLGNNQGESFTSAQGFSKTGRCTWPGYEGKTFEPADEYKGDMARTYFYMVTCYEEKLADWHRDYANKEGVGPTIDGTPYPALTSWQLAMLMEWARRDPVSEKETRRNEAVWTIQQNRNPFIDYPGLEEYVWGSMKSQPFSYDHYRQPTAISSTHADKKKDPKTTYNTAGQRIGKAKKGINIVRTSRSHARKILKK